MTEDNDKAEFKSPDIDLDNPESEPIADLSGINPAASLALQINASSGISTQLAIDSMLRFPELMFPIGWNSELRTALGNINQLFTANEDALNAIGVMHQSWQREFDRLAIPLGNWDELFRATIPDFTEVLSKIALPANSNEEFIANFNTAGNFGFDIQRSLSGFEHTFADLVNSISGLDELVRRPSFLLPGATHELYSTDRVLGSLQTSDQRPNSFNWELEPQSDKDVYERSALIKSLASFDPSWGKMYEGACVALDAANPDRSRHVLASLRQLLDSVVRVFAPVKEVEQWIDERGDVGLVTKNGPNLRAKLLYVVKDLDDEPLADFVEADADVMLKLYRLYNRLHKDETGFTGNQLRAIVFRTGSFLQYVLLLREMSHE